MMTSSNNLGAVILLVVTLTQNIRGGIHVYQIQKEESFTNVLLKITIFHCLLVGTRIGLLDFIIFNGILRAQLDILELCIHKHIHMHKRTLKQQ